MDPATLQKVFAALTGQGSNNMGFLQKATQPQTFMFPGSVISQTPVLDIQNLPFLPESAQSLGPLFGMFVEPMITSMIGPNYVPVQFSGIQNPYEVFRKRQEYQNMMRFAGLWTAQDQEQLVRFIRGMTMLSGTPWSLEQEASARAATQQLSQFLPYMGMLFPSFVDALYGREGSQVHLARQIFSAARYRMDPLLGTRGLSEHQMTLLLSEISNRLYGTNAEVDLAQRYSLGKAELGSFIDYAARMGFGPRTVGHQEALLMRSLDTAQQMEVLRGLQLGGGMPFGAAQPSPLQTLKTASRVLDELKNVASSPEMQRFIQEFDTQRMVAFYQNMADAISAMKDIFGGLGVADAPMPQIMEGLKVLSSGGMFRMDPKQLAELMRNLQVSARLSQMDMNSMTVLVSNTAKFLESYGGDISLAPHIAAQVAIRNAALANQGFGITSGGVDREKYQAYEMRLSAQAASSPAAMNLAALYRMVQQMGYTPRAGTEAEALVQALVRGDSTYRFQGEERPVYDPQRFMTILGQSGLPMEVFFPSAQSRQANQATLRDNPQLLSVVRDMQAVELTQNLRQRMQRIQLPNVSQQDSFRLANAYLDLVLGGKYGLDITAASRDPRAFEMFLLALRENPQIMQKYGIHPDFINRLQQGDVVQLRALFQRFWEEIGQAAEEHRFETPDVMIQLMSGSSTEYRQVLEAQRRIDVKMMEAFSGIGRGNFMQRLLEAVKGASPQTTTKDILAQALGYVPTEDLLTPELMQAVEELRNLQERATGTTKNVLQTEQASRRMQTTARLATQQIVRSFQQSIQKGAVARDDPMLAALEQKLQELNALKDPREVLKKTQEILNVLPDEEEIARDRTKTEEQKTLLIETVRSTRQSLKTLMLYTEAYMEQYRRTFGDRPFAEVQGKTLPEQMRLAEQAVLGQIPNQVQELGRRIASIEGRAFVRASIQEASRVHTQLASGLGGGEQALTGAVSLASRVLLDEQSLELLGEKGAQAALRILQARNELDLFAQETGVPLSVLLLPSKAIEEAEKLSQDFQAESLAVQDLQAQIEAIQKKGAAATPEERARLETLTVQLRERAQKLQNIRDKSTAFSGLYGVDPFQARQAWQTLTPQQRQLAASRRQVALEATQDLVRAYATVGQPGPIEPIRPETRRAVEALREEVTTQVPSSAKQREFLQGALSGLFGLSEARVSEETLQKVLAQPNMDKKAAQFARAVSQLNILTRLDLGEQEKEFQGDPVRKAQYILGELERARKLLQSEKEDERKQGRDILSRFRVPEVILPEVLLATKGVDFEALRTVGQTLQLQAKNLKEATGSSQIDVSADALRLLIEAAAKTPAPSDLRSMLDKKGGAAPASRLTLDQTRALSVSTMLVPGPHQLLGSAAVLLPVKPPTAETLPDKPPVGPTPPAAPPGEQPAAPGQPVGPSGPTTGPGKPVSEAVPPLRPEIGQPQQLAIVGTLNIPGIGSGTIRGFGYYSNVGGARS